jgi:LPS sulfotransferase NodH
VTDLAGSDGSLPGGGWRLFVVIGAQRTGTNILREILNSNERIAMLGEVLSPSPAPAHWHNFCRRLPPARVLDASASNTEALLDQYFDFVRYRIRNHWEGNRKSRSRAFGVDIKYNQLRRIAPAGWDCGGAPFILGYLRSRGAILIHTTRNVIHSAISMMIASQRNLWHNYDGRVIDRSYHVEPEQCLAHARTMLCDREAFLSSTNGCTVVDCAYEQLVGDLGRTECGQQLRDAPGPLRNIAAALGAPFNFRHDGRLQKAINIPYSRLLSNHEALLSRVRESEFSQLAATLD